MDEDAARGYLQHLIATGRIVPTDPAEAAAAVLPVALPTAPPVTPGAPVPCRHCQTPVSVLALRCQVCLAWRPGEPGSASPPNP